MWSILCILSLPFCRCNSDSIFMSFYLFPSWWKLPYPLLNRIFHVCVWEIESDFSLYSIAKYINNNFYVIVLCSSDFYYNVCLHAYTTISTSTSTTATSTCQMIQNQMSAWYTLNQQQTRLHNFKHSWAPISFIESMCCAALELQRRVSTKHDLSIRRTIAPLQTERNGMEWNAFVDRNR